jgi:hypothetical protein
MTTYVSWFNRVIGLMAGKGITLKGVTYHAYPIRVCKCGAVFSEGRCPKCDKGTDWRKTACTKDNCGSKNAFVFQSKEDPDVFFTFCQKCGKYDVSKGIPPKLSKYVPNTPPVIGSKTKPTPEEIAAYEKQMAEATKAVKS